MIKLTDDEIDEIWSNASHDPDSNDFARAIEDEVLRINGWQPIETAPKDGAEILLGEQGSGDYELARYHVDMGKWLDRCSDELHFTPTHWRDPMPPAASSDHIDDAWLTEKPGDRVYKNADELFDALGIDTKTRATGCPDTMDDMGRFAVDQKTAGEEKSPPATGPAG